MPKDYLNRNEREIVAFALLLHANLEDMLEKSGKHMSKAERNACAKVMEWVAKYTGQCGARVGKAEFKKVTDIVLTQGIVFKDRKPQAVEDTRNIIEVDVDSFAYVAEAVIEGNCKNCNKDKDGVEACKVREFMTQADVPAFDNYNVCQYKMR